MSGSKSISQADNGLVNGFPIVGIGASAGGLEAFIQLLEALPSDTGMAFILIQHLAPNHESLAPEGSPKQPMLNYSGGQNTK